MTLHFHKWLTEEYFFIPPVEDFSYPNRADGERAMYMVKQWLNGYTQARQRCTKCEKGRLINLGIGDVRPGHGVTR